MSCGGGGDTVVTIAGIMIMFLAGCITWVQIGHEIEAFTTGCDVIFNRTALVVMGVMSVMLVSLYVAIGHLRYDAFSYYGCSIVFVIVFLLQTIAIFLLQEDTHFIVSREPDHE